MIANTKQDLRAMIIKISETNKTLSANAGTLLINKLIKKTKLESLLKPFLPQQKQGASRNWNKIQNLILGLSAGAECLDDMKSISEDAAAQVLMARSYHPKSYGDLLRGFSGEKIWHIQGQLMKFSYDLRKSVFPDAKKIIFDCDSTLNRQYARKMEGVQTTYEGFDALSSLNIFDQFGFQYFMDVRPGATHTSQGIEDPVHRLLSHIRNDHDRRGVKRPKICFRADAGYYNVSFLNACLAKNADVLVCVNKRDNFSKIASQVQDWQAPDINDPKRIKFYDKRECEIGSTVYRPKGCAQRLRYVIIRAKKPEETLFPDHSDNYDYRAFCTNYSENLFTNEEIIFLYQKRGHAENFIRENKYGFDLKHYPCLKLNANRAYALIAAYAYNLLRLIALIENSQKPHFSKKIRNTWIRIPCMVARTARDSIFRFMPHHAKEISLWLKRIHMLQFEFV